MLVYMFINSCEFKIGSVSVNGCPNSNWKVQCRSAVLVRWTKSRQHRAVGLCLIVDGYSCAN